MRIDPQGVKKMTKTTERKKVKDMRICSPSEDVTEALQNGRELRDATLKWEEDEQPTKYISEAHHEYIKQKSQLKMIVSSFYDMQKQRVAVGNRIVGNFLLRIGGKETMEKDDDDKKLIIEITKEYQTMADALTSPKKIRSCFESKREGFITTEHEWTMVTTYLSYREAEKKLMKDIKRYVEDFPLYQNFLEHISGCGPAMSAVIITCFDPYVAKHVSSFWKYAGLDVIDGEGRSRKKRHQIIEKYVDRNQDIDWKFSISYNAFLKAKLCGVLAISFLRCGKGSSKYNTIYYDYKDRLTNSEKHKTKSDGHRHAMAMRYMIKMFVADVWVQMRSIEELPITEPYHEAKLGLVHGNKVKTA